MVKGGVHGEGACMAKGVWQRRECMAKGGMCAKHPPPDTTRYSRSMRGRYASYWNVFLLQSYLQELAHNFEFLVNIRSTSSNVYYLKSLNRKNFKEH